MSSKALSVALVCDIITLVESYCRVKFLTLGALDVIFKGYYTLRAVSYGAEFKSGKLFVGGCDLNRSNC